MVIKAKKPDSLEDTAAYALDRISRTLKRMGLELAIHKTEAIILRDWRKCKNVNMKLENTNIALQTWLKYMGIYIDYNWNFHFYGRPFSHVVGSANLEERCGT